MCSAEHETRECEATMKVRDSIQMVENAMLEKDEVGTVCLAGWLAGWLAVCLSGWLAGCLCISVCLSIYIYIFLCLSISVSLCNRHLKMRLGFVNFSVLLSTSLGPSCDTA